MQRTSRLDENHRYLPMYVVEGYDSEDGTG